MHAINSLSSTALPTTFLAGEKKGYGLDSRTQATLTPAADRPRHPAAGSVAAPASVVLSSSSSSVVRATFNGRVKNLEESYEHKISLTFDGRLEDGTGLLKGHFTGVVFDEDPRKAIDSVEGELYTNLYRDNLDCKVKGSFTDLLTGEKKGFRGIGGFYDAAEITTTSGEHFSVYNI